MERSHVAEPRARQLFKVNGNRSWRCRWIDCVWEVQNVGGPGRRVRFEPPGTGEHQVCAATERLDLSPYRCPPFLVDLKSCPVIRKVVQQTRDR